MRDLHPFHLLVSFFSTLYNSVLPERRWNSWCGCDPLHLAVNLLKIKIFSIFNKLFYILKVVETDVLHHFFYMRN